MNESGTNTVVAIPDQQGEKALIDAGLPVPPIVPFKETAREQRLRLFLAEEDRRAALVAPAINLDDRIRAVVREEFALLMGKAKKTKKRSKK